MLVSHKAGEPLVAGFDSFAVVAGNATGAAPAAREALLRLDVGLVDHYTDGARQVWTPDTGRFTPATAPTEGIPTDAIAGTTDDPLYATYRGNVGSVTPRTLTYTLPTRAATKVDLRLHFAERAAANNTAGKRVFDIDVEGETVRTGFDIFAAAGGLNTATVLGINNVDRPGRRAEPGAQGHRRLPGDLRDRGALPGRLPGGHHRTGRAHRAHGHGCQPGITLDWADNPEADLVGYRVYRAAAADGTFTEVTTTPVASSTYVDTTAPANAQSFYRVVAIDTSDNASAPSAVVSATRPQPVQQAVRINTGGPAQTVSGTAWSACSSLTACSNWVTGGNAYSETDTITGIPAGTNNTMFQSEWTGARPVTRSSRGLARLRVLGPGAERRRTRSACTSPS